MYTLDQIYDQAVNDNKPITTTMPFGASIIKMGIKIQKFKDRIEILNLSKGGSYYKLCDDKEYDIFKKNVSRTRIEFHLPTFWHYFWYITWNTISYGSK